jgi:hypothetical protein
MLRFSTRATLSGGKPMQFPDSDMPGTIATLTVAELRDYFAVKVMQALVAGLTHQDKKKYREGLGGHEAEVAYAIADAMLAQRLK